jgi:hypothetical protein
VAPWNRTAADDKSEDYPETFNQILAPLPARVTRPPPLGIVAPTHKLVADERAPGTCAPWPHETLPLVPGMWITFRHPHRLTLGAIPGSQEHSAKDHRQWIIEPPEKVTGDG